MEDKISQKTIDQYIKVGGEYCPFCQSPEVLQDGYLFYDEETSSVYKPMMCLTCLRDWTDVFGLVGIKDMVPMVIEAEVA